MKNIKLILPLLLAIIFPLTMAKVITVSYAYTLTSPVTPPVTMPIITTLRLVSPNGGERIAQNSKTMISWKSSPDIKKIDISYSNGLFSKKIATVYSGDSYIWKVANTSLTNNGKIILTAIGVNGSKTVDASDKSFSIVK